MVYVIQVCWQLASKLSANLCVLLCVQWKTADDGQRNCPKHVEFYSKNKFEKLVRLVGFIIRIYHDARSPESQYITLHGHLKVNMSRCTVTWKSICHDARSPESQYITMHGHRNGNRAARGIVTYRDWRLGRAHSAQMSVRLSVLFRVKMAG